MYKWSNLSSLGGITQHLSLSYTAHPRRLLTFNMVARISTLLAVASLFLAPLASANPIEEKRQHSTEWAPPIISPVGGDVWTIGQQASVTWYAFYPARLPENHLLIFLQGCVSQAR